MTGWNSRLGGCRLVVIGSSILLTLALLVPRPAEGKWAKGPVYGTIKYSDGKPAAGVRVRAFDYDGMGELDKNDRVGEATTGPDGSYKILVEGKHWDPAPHNVTTWRPDVFITVLRNVGGQWVRVGKSRTYDNKKHRDSLRIDLQIPADQWVTGTTAFQPERHGWPFKNQKFHVCWQEKNLCGDYSLCGGMSLSALSRFRNHSTIPGGDPPSPQTLEELKNAQLDTLGNGVWSKFLEFTQSPTLPHTIAYHTIGKKTLEEIPKLRKALDSRAPIILGLIRVNQSNLARDIFKNHQVLAAGYRFNQGTGEMRITVYDPNHPKKTSEISLHTKLPNNQLGASQTTLYWNDRTKRNDPVVEKVRGLFVIPVGSGPPKTTGGAPGKRPATGFAPIRRR